MNLYLRLIWTLLRAWRLPPLAVGETLTRSMRVWPNDLDLNAHLNNGRYLTMIDLMLIECFVRAGFAPVLLKNGWRPMAGGSFITYRRGLSPFQRFDVRFRIDACDASWNYMRFEFITEGRLHAAGYVKGAIVGKDGLVPNAVGYAAMNLAPPSTPLPDAVIGWLAAEKGIMTTPWAEDTPSVAARAEG
ncbi:MAG: thioesterase family protein [Alphaproteobacteria bacterium]